MKTKIHMIAAVTLIIIVYLAYIIKFYFILDHGISDSTGTWGELGDYAGGVLNPLLSFISIVLLIKSLTLQHEANSSLKVEVKNNEKAERLRSFEVIFFNLISAQKNLFDSFEMEFLKEDKSKNKLSGAKAVIEIENNIALIRSDNNGRQQVVNYLNQLDDTDQIFGLSRAFYIIVMTVDDRLSNDKQFSMEDRKIHYKALINFTDFAQLRLIMICAQFLNYESAKYLRSSKEFKCVLKELGLNYDLY